jgi:hypothetical protein
LVTAPSTADGLLAYGKLYLFADMYLADRIKQISFVTIKIRLACSLVDATTVQELVNMLQYVAGQECTDDGVGVGPLRKYVVAFTAKNLARLVTFDSFKALLKAGGEMMKDIVVASHSGNGQ